ncbi:MAG: hypothetical protein ACP5T4_02325 [Candidatus Micrarchaeia archaeon]
MMPFLILLATSLLVFSGAAAALFFVRHFALVILSIELMFVASTLLLVSFFTFMANPGSDGIMLLFSLWAIAAAEAMALITFYIFMKSKGFNFDIRNLNRLKW